MKIVGTDSFYWSTDSRGNRENEKCTNFWMLPWNGDRARPPISASSLLQDHHPTTAGPHRNPILFLFRYARQFQFWLSIFFNRVVKLVSLSLCHAYLRKPDLRKREDPMVCQRTQISPKRAACSATNSFPWQINKPNFCSLSEEHNLES